MRLSRRLRPSHVPGVVCRFANSASDKGRPSKRRTSGTLANRGWQRLALANGSRRSRNVSEWSIQ